MKKKNRRTAWIILSLYLAATFALLLFGYSLQKPKTAYQEFPFTITYSYQGKTETISDIYAAEYARKAKYLGESSTAWTGYVKDRNRLESDFYRIAEQGGNSFSINLNLIPGYLVGDPRFSGAECAPTAVCHSFDGETETVTTDPAELEAMGFFLISWDYPQPIENRFSYGGISMSSEAVIFTSALAAAALLACILLVKKDPELIYRKTDKLSLVLNYLVFFLVFPFIFILSALSEITADATFIQQILYFAPALTLLGIAASVVMRRFGQKTAGLLCQFAGPAAAALAVLTGI